MSRSYRTQKEATIANKRMPRDRSGSIVYPRVVERKPSPGDIHPVSKPVLSRLFCDMIPLEYVYGLKRVELRPRRNNQIGYPFGEYQWDEPVIRLYSLPLEWSFKGFDKQLLDSVVSCNGIVRLADSGEDLIHVKWPGEACLGLWFYSYVITHELGHHFNERYKTKNSRSKAGKYEELVADLHAKRLTEALHKELLRRVREREANRKQKLYGGDRTS